MSRIKKIFKVESAEKRWMNTQEATVYMAVRFIQANKLKGISKYLHNNLSAMVGYSAILIFR